MAITGYRMWFHMTRERESFDNQHKSMSKEPFEGFSFWLNRSYVTPVSGKHEEEMTAFYPYNM